MSRAGLVGGILLAGAISGLCMLYIWQGNRLHDLTATAEEARDALEADLEVNRILEVRIEEAFSLERIARIARSQLGMSEPDPADIRYVPLHTGKTD